MTALLLWGGWGKLNDLVAWLIRHPMAALSLCLAIWGWSGHRSADKWHKQAAKITSTLVRERAATQAATRAAKAQSRKDAQDADTNHTALASGGDGRFAAYAAGHGMRQSAPYRASPAQTDTPILPENPSPDTIMAEISRVWITRSDWLTCDADWAYAQGGYEWGQRIAE